MDELRTEPSRRSVPRCLKPTSELRYCDNCEVCNTLPATFKELLNIKVRLQNFNVLALLNFETHKSISDFYAKYGTDNHELLVQYENGETILHWLVMYTDLYTTSRNPLLPCWQTFVEMVKILLDLAPELCSITNDEGETPLCASTKYCTQTPSVIHLLIKKYQESALNIPDNKGNTPLFNVLQIGGLARHPEPHNNRAVRTTHISAFLTIEKVVKQLLPYININTENKEGFNLLQFLLNEMLKLKSSVYMIENNSPELYVNGLLKFYEEIICGLLSRHAPICSKSGHHAISFVSNINLAKTILRMDSTEINKRDRNGCTPLTSIRNNKRDFKDKLDVIVLMCNYGAEDENEFETINQILEKNPEHDVNMIDSNGATMLINYANNIDIVSKLLELGADPSIKTDQNTDVFTSACQSENLEVVEKLLETGIEFIPNSLALTATIRNYFKSSENNEEWMKIFKYLCNLPSINGKNLIHSLPQFIQFGNHETQKMWDILIYIIKEKNDLVTMPLELPKIKIYLFNTNVYINPLAWLLLHTSCYSWYYDFIQQILNINQQVLNVPQNCITPLTALLLGRNSNKGNIEYLADEIKISNIASSMMEKGVNINSNALRIRDIDRRGIVDSAFPHGQQIHINALIYRDNCIILKNTMFISDALFLSIVTNQYELTKKLLPTWFGPPTALFIFNSWDLSFVQFLTWIGILATSVNKVQKSTQAYVAFTREFTMHRDCKIETVQDMVAAGDRILAAIDSDCPVYHDVADFYSVCSLRDLSIYKVRMLVAARAAKTGESISELLQQVDVPPLISNILLLK